MESKQTQITIFGSTGSIGTQTLDVISVHPDRFRAQILTAGHNWQLLAEQALRHRPELVIIADHSGYLPLKEALSGTGIEVASGTQAIIEAAGRHNDDIVVGAMVGYSGLRPTLRALEMGKTVALANKETLVAGGRIVTETCRRTGAKLLPVDSEHSAIFQCIQGEQHSSIRKILLTASGGPFRTWTKERFKEITPADALKHPNWDMGAKVTIDSATMMNKGFEMIEARWLFDVKPCDIEVLVHPQSVVHSMIEFIDGSIKAQLGIPDMRTPIRYALGYPERLATNLPSLNFADYTSLTFEAPDMDKFPLLKLAYKVIEIGESAPVVLNAANEVAVANFLKHRLRFIDIYGLVDATLQAIPLTKVETPDDIAAIHEQAVSVAENLITRFNTI